MVDLLFLVFPIEHQSVYMVLIYEHRSFQALISCSWRLLDHLFRKMRMSTLIEVILWGSGSAPPVLPKTGADASPTDRLTAQPRSPHVMAHLLVAPPHS